METDQGITLQTDKLSEIKARIDRFLFGNWFFIFCAALSFSAWTLGAFWLPAVHIVISAFAVIIIYLLFFCDDISPVIPLLAVLIFVLPGENFAYNRDDENLRGVMAYAWHAVWLLFIIAGVVYYFVKRKPKFKKSRLFWPTVVFSAVMPLSGLFSGYYTGTMNITMFLFMMLMYPAAAILLFNLCGKVTLEYFAKSVLAAGAVLFLETCVFFIAHPGVLTDPYEWVVLGWGMSNNIAVILAMAVPAAFYLALNGKADVYYLAAAFVLSIGVALTKARGAILLLAAAYPFMIFFYLKQSPKEMRKRRAIILSCCAAAALTVALIFIRQLWGIVEKFKEMGLSNNGRFEIWLEALNVFAKHPVFGAGFAYPSQAVENNPFYTAHNTLLQFLASCGIVGLLACLYLFVSRYLLFFKAWKPHHVFFLIMMLGYEIYGMVDISPFLPYALFLTCVLFNSLEQSCAE